MEKPEEYYENEIELMDILNVVWKRKWLIIIPTFIIVILAAVYSLILPKLWEVDAIIEPSKFLVQTEQGNFNEIYVADAKQLSGQINHKTYNQLIAAELNIDLQKFPKIEAENLRDTKLIQVKIKSGDVNEAKSILISLFKHMKRDLDKKIDVEIKSIDTQVSSKENLIKGNKLDIKDNENQITLKKLIIKDKQNEIKTKQNAIKKNKNKIESKELEIQSQEIEKDRIAKEIESYKERLKISRERVENILKEMKSVKERIDEIDEQQKKSLAEKKAGIESLSLLLYSNEIQQNLRYYNTLDEKLSNEKITQENLQLSIRNKEEGLRQIDNQISQIKNQIEDINTDIDNINTQIEVIKTEIDKINNDIKTIHNNISKIINQNATIENEKLLLEDEKARIDYAKLIKAPTSSINPVAPRKKRMVLIAGFLSLFIFTMLAFFLDYIKKNKILR